MAGFGYGNLPRSNDMYPWKGHPDYDPNHGEAYEWWDDAETLLPTGILPGGAEDFEPFGGWDSREPGGGKYSSLSHPYALDTTGRCRDMAGALDLDRWAKIPERSSWVPEHSRWANVHRRRMDAHGRGHILDPYQERDEGMDRFGHWRAPASSKFGTLTTQSNNSLGFAMEPPRGKLPYQFYLNGDDYGQPRAYVEANLRESWAAELAEDRRLMLMDADFYDPEF